MIQILNGYYMGCTDTSYVLYKSDVAIGYYSSVKGLVEGMVRDCTLCKIKLGELRSFGEIMKYQEDLYREIMEWEF